MQDLVLPGLCGMRMTDTLTPDERETAAAALSALNGGKVCRKCGAEDDTGLAKASRSGGGGYGRHAPGEHDLEYNKAKDTLDVTCWRCKFMWSRTPDDRKALT